MLKSTSRLKKEKDFGKVLRSGKKIRDEFLAIRFVAGSGEKTRFGVSVSKRVSKKATKRNKIRRQELALCAALLPRIKGKLDIVIFALPGLEKKSFPEIKEMTEKIFLKAQIL